MKKLFSLAVLLLLLASCTSELDQMINGSRSDKARPTTVFQASVEGCTMPETKVYADEEMKVLWNADDRVSIFNLTTYNYQYAFTGDDGDTAGGFDLIPDSGFITGTNVDYVYAAYPYSKTNKLSNQGVFTMVLPAEQSYKEHSFGIGANTMVAITDGSFLAFKNVGGYLSLRLYGDNISVSRITIKGNNGEKIAGKASIDIPFGGTPTVTMDATATDNVSVVCDPAVKIGEDANNYTDFWFVIPPVTFEKGFTITVTDDKGGVFEKSTTKSFTVSRNTLDWMSALKVVPNYDNAIVQFEDANFKAYCVENFDTNNDGEISPEEAEGVTEMTVNPEIIASLKGIEYFKNLQSLTCSLNWSRSKMIDGVRHYYNANGEEVNSLLVSVDISGNPALTYLDCSSLSLTSLDVSKNTALINLQCNNNQLTSLDVSRNSALTNLNCSGNKLTSLDISNSSSLKELYCHGNQLTSLDLSRSLELKSLYCDSNKLTSLDVSHNTNLVFLECGNNQLSNLSLSNNTSLKSLYCYDNQLSSLDVSHNDALGFLFCYNNRLTSLDVSHNPALAVLYCQYNQLTSMDVSKNTALEDFRCQYNQLTSLDVSNNTKMYHLYCQENPLTSLDVSNNKKLTILNCSSAQMETLYLEAGQEITELSKWAETKIVYKGALPTSFPDEWFCGYVFAFYDLDGNGFLSQEECDAVTSIDVNTEYTTSLKGIEFFKNLRSLTCKPEWTSSSSNNAGEWHIYDKNRNRMEVIGLLTELDVSNNTALEFLDCGGNQLTALDLSKNTMLTELSCDFNHLTELDLSCNSALASLKCGPNPITNLDLSHNSALNLLDCYCSPLTSLDVSKNTALTNLRVVACQLAALDVSKNTELINLSVYSNQLTTLDIDYNTKLTHLDCGFNNLATINVRNNKSLVGLACHHNLLSSLVISDDISLISLTCQSNQLTYLDLSKNTALQELYCSSNQLTSLDVSYNTSLDVLDCSNNQLTSLSLYGNGFALTKLDCSQNKLTALDFPDGYYYPLKELYCGENDISSLNLNNLSSLQILSCRALPISVIEIPKAVTTLSWDAFRNCTLLTEVLVPASVTEIGDSAFADCPLLTAVKIHNETPPSLGNQVFDGSPNCLIYVLQSALETYQTATVWSTFADRLRVFGQTGGHEGIGYDDWE